MTKRLLLTTIRLLISASPAVVFSSLNTMLQDAYNAYNSEKAQQQLSQGFSFGNIYEQSYQVAKNRFARATAETVYETSLALNGRYSCDITPEEAMQILLSIDSTSAEIVAMAEMVKRPLAASGPDDIGGACGKLIGCIEGRLNRQERRQLQSEGILTCRSITSEIYNEIAGPAKRKIALGSYVMAQDIYYNGNIEDAPYDILFDIQRIGDILFGQNEQTPRALFFTFPEGSIAGTQAINFGNNGSQISVGTRPQTQGSTPSQGTPDRSGVTPQNTNTNQLGTPQNTQSGQQPSQTQQSSQSSAQRPAIGPVTITNTSQNSAIENFACVSEPVRTNQPLFIAPTNNTQDQPRTASPNTTSAFTSQGVPTPIFAVNGPSADPLTLPATQNFFNPASIESPTAFEQQEKAIQACTAKCDGLRAIDKSMCIAKCMCTMVKSNNGMYGIRICTVPTVQYDIAGGKSVLSIEEILEEINNVLTNLKNSGQLMKHTKRTEMLDTTLSRIQLHQTFAFDINFGFKPLIPQKQQRAIQQKNAQEADQYRFGTFGSIDIGKEKNKYIIFGQAENTLAGTIESTNEQEILAALQTAQRSMRESQDALAKNISSSLVKTQNGEMQDIVNEFLENNIRFWLYVNETLVSIQNNANEIRQKIEKR